MVDPFTTIAVGGAIHLLKKVIDRVFWPEIRSGANPVIGGPGTLRGYADFEGDRVVIRRQFSTNERDEYQLVFGSLYFPSSLAGLQGELAVPLILVIEETTQDILFFPADSRGGYEIELPLGIYSFHAFLVDAFADDLNDAEIYAAGFPSRIDLSDTDRFIVETPGAVLSLVDDSPREIERGSPYYLDMILIDVDEIPGFPSSFADFDGDGIATGAGRWAINLTGEWYLQEIYESGDTDAEVHLLQRGAHLDGLVVIQGVTDDGRRYVVQEALVGTVDGTQLSLEGTEVRVIKGRPKDYYLDRWAGVIDDVDLIVGVSQDEAGTSGSFRMTRVSDA